jgi:hypothetical protein
VTADSRRRRISRATAWLSRSPESGARRTGVGPRVELGWWPVWLAVRATSPSVVRLRQVRQSARRQLGMLPPVRLRHGGRAGMEYSSARLPTLRLVARARHTCAHDRPAGASRVALRPLPVSWAQYLRPCATVGTDSWRGSRRSSWRVPSLDRFTSRLEQQTGLLTQTGLARGC